MPVVDGNGDNEGDSVSLAVKDTVLEWDRDAVALEVYERVKLDVGETLSVKDAVDEAVGGADVEMEPEGVEEAVPVTVSVGLEVTVADNVVVLELVLDPVFVPEVDAEAVFVLVALADGVPETVLESLELPVDVPEPLKETETVGVPLELDEMV